MLYKKPARLSFPTSIIGLGGEWLNDKTQEEVTAIIDAAIEGGMNYLDIFMPQPQTRSHIGQALKGRRDKMHIQGHLCTVFEDNQYERTRDLAKTKAGFGDLLARLQTDYIDVGMLHYVDSEEDYASVFNTPIIEYALSLKQKGIIHHLGMSSHNPLIALKAVETGLIDVLLFSINAAYDLEKADTDIYSLIEFKDLSASSWSIDPARQTLYSACEREGVGITVMKPLGAGSLLKAETSPFGKAMSVTQCNHYCLTRPAVCSVLVGCASPAEVHEALAYLSATDAEKDYAPILSGAGKIQMTGRCMYCNHCQPCPAHIDVAAVTKFLDMATMQENVPPSVRQHYAALKKNAGDCLMCGQCEENCPFQVKVRENMERAQRVFG